MDRRLFLIGTGGTFFGLPILESLAFGKDRGPYSVAPKPYVIFVYQPMGPQVNNWWPTSTGKLSSEKLTGRNTAAMIPFADKISIIKGLGHGNEQYYNAGDHGESICQTLTGALVNKPNGNEMADYPRKASIDHVIAKAFDPKGSSLNLAVGNRNGPGLSWAGDNSANSAEYSPNKAFLNLFPGGVVKSDGKATTVVDDKAKLRKGVNDLVKEQMDALLKNPKLSANDKERLKLHMSNIRDIETQLITDIDFDADLKTPIMNSKIDGKDRKDRKITAKMHIDIMAIAAATGQKRAMTLQLNEPNHDVIFNGDGSVSAENNYHNGVSHADNADGLKKYDTLCQSDFAYLLTALDEYKFESGGKSLLDYGLSTFIISLGWGARHWRHDLPHIIAGNVNGQLRQGYYVDVVPETKDDDRKVKFVPTNRLFSTIGKVVGVEQQTKDFNAQTPPKDASKRLTQNGIIPEILKA